MKELLEFIDKHDGELEWYVHPKLDLKIFRLSYKIDGIKFTYQHAIPLDEFNNSKDKERLFKDILAVLVSEANRI